MSKRTVIVQPRVRLGDPHDCTDSPDVVSVLDAVFDALVRPGPNGRHLPGLAEAWEVSDDARRWTFHLRRGLRFHDGSAIDAEAVRLSLQRMSRPDMGATLGAPAVWAQYLAGMRLDVPDAWTIRLETVEPLADLLDILVDGYILPPAQAAAEHGAVRVGSGPYCLEAVDGGLEIVARANPEHYRGRPVNDVVVWRCEPEPALRVEALMSGAAQVAIDLDRQVAARLDANDAATRVDYLAPTAYICIFNAAAGPMRDPRLRRALNLGLDRQTLIDKVLGGTGQPLTGFVSPLHFGADGANQPDAHDVARAHELLEEANLADGLRLTLDSPTRLPDEAQGLAAELKRQFAQLGVALDIRTTEDRVAYANNVREKRIADMCIFDSSPLSTFRVLREKIDSRSQGAWWQGYRNREVGALLDRACATARDRDRERLYRQCVELLREDPPWLYLYNHLRTVGLAGHHPDWRMRFDGVLETMRLPRF